MSKFDFFRLLNRVSENFSLSGLIFRDFCFCGEKNGPIFLFFFKLSHCKGKVLTATFGNWLLLFFISVGSSRINVVLLCVVPQDSEMPYHSQRMLAASCPPFFLNKVRVTSLSSGEAKETVILKNGLGQWNWFLFLGLGHILENYPPEVEQRGKTPEK